MSVPAASRGVRGIPVSLTKKPLPNKEDPMIRTFPLHGSIRLDCRTGFGAVTVHAAEDTTEAAVTISQREADSDALSRTQVELRGSTLSVRAPKPRGTVFDMPFFSSRWAHRDALDIEVTVPAGTAMSITSWGADVCVTGRAGNVDLAGGSTASEIADVDGNLRLRVGSGASQVGRVRGSALVKSGSGDAQFDEVGGALSMLCGSGNLQVAVARGPVRMRAGSGTASIGRAHGDINLISGSGGMSIGLPPGQPARLEVTTGTGRLDSELPVSDAAPDTSAAAITIRARTGSGNIRLYRATD
jgi:hypothetical protein